MNDCTQDCRQGRDCVCGGITHIYPMGDLRDHQISKKCWCSPKVEDGSLVIHNSMDGREAFETGERKPS